LVAAHAASDLGRERVAALRPALRREDLDERRAAFEEAARLLVAGGALVPSFDEALAPVVAALTAHRETVGGRELVLLAAMARAVVAARERVAAAPAPPLAILAARFAGDPDPAPFAARVAKTLDRRGEVREDASPRLAELRRAVRGLRDRLYRELGQERARLGDEVVEETIPLRHNRLVLLAAADARGRLSGLFHGRSGSGKSYYFEPLATVELNNQLEQAIGDEAEEKRRILIELVAFARSERGAIERAALRLGELDALQAAVGFAASAQARLAEVDSRRLTLVAARHPLLDPRLAALRETALGSPGHRDAAVPLDLELGGDAPARLLVVTGPNAGGKTVALKTTGLLALLHQSGLPVPAAAGTRFPFFDRLVATVGDEQDLLADRSTFSGRLLRLREAWEAAGPRSLILLDELGSGTDPDEGAALSEALLEALLARGALGIITTHLVRLAAAALELDGAACAAMEFDPATGQPTYRLLPGPPGGSEAIALARRLGLPRTWLDRAEAKLGGGHRDLRRLLAELEAARDETRTVRERLETESEDARKLGERLARELAALEAERRTLATQLKRELETFRREARKRFDAEVERLRGEYASGRRRGLESEAVERLFADAPAPPAPIAVTAPQRPLVAGDAVRHRVLSWIGRIEKIDGVRATVRVRGKKLTTALADLELAQPDAKGKDAPPRAPLAARSAPTPSTELEAAGPRELNLIGMRAEPALEAIDRFLDRALRDGAAEVRLIHGHGTGRLREAVRSELRHHAAVAAQRPGAPNEGGNGATIVTLRRG
jgi:DNA mismatch repair protein MutS2